MAGRPPPQMPRSSAPARELELELVELEDAEGLKPLLWQNQIDVRGTLRGSTQLWP